MAQEAASGENKHGKTSERPHTKKKKTMRKSDYILQIMNSHYGRIDVLRCVCDLHNVSRLALSSVDMEQRDYDLRTALHVAAAEGEALQKKQKKMHSVLQ